ncbi:MAG: putative GTPase [Solidesulfovibrio magneticus str. Maddingley MBC34]|uniref:Putative GTPase n=1 Tax=Solidesulfovibrio magneticus str. Maddingley MBC34 TaxID=1206767 RepID=K6GSX6_9BACT|nr:MAG: putative GTPase [Solidesulfovibrio magneticus str. Maddingley MBC34]
MTTTLLEARYLALRGELTGHLGRLCELLAACGRPEGAATARELLTHAAEPFLFVVVGEVKAGKSSLINALLGAQVTDVAPDPCTDRIRVIGRQETVAKAPSGDLVVRVAVDNPLLDGLAIVDTPGVDSIIDRHQEITEAFIPRADLALFTFSVLNPYSRSAWEFFDLVAGAWGRRVAFALTMADLASREQIAVNTGRLRELARERGVEEPVVFLISSEKSHTDPEAGGIEALRRHIRELTAGGGHFAGKLDATRRSALRLLQELGDSLDERGRELAADSAEADRIRSRLDTARLAAGREAEVLRTRVEAAYARLSEEFLAAFAAELTLGGMLGRSVASLWRRGKDAAGPTKRLAELGEAFGRDLEREVESIAAVGAAHIFESVSGYARMLLDELRQRRSASVAPHSDPLSGERDRVLAEVAGRVETLLAEGGPMAGLDAKSVATMDPRAAMGGALVVLGTIFAVSVKSAVIDVTGGVVAALGALIAGSALYWQRPKVLREMRRRLAHGGEKLRQELDERLSARLDRIFRELGDRFEPFFADIAARGETLAGCRTRRDELDEALRRFSAQ